MLVFDARNIGNQRLNSGVAIIANSGQGCEERIGVKAQRPVGGEITILIWIEW